MQQQMPGAAGQQPPSVRTSQAAPNVLIQQTPLPSAGAAYYSNTQQRSPYYAPGSVPVGSPSFMPHAHPRMQQQLSVPVGSPQAPTANMAFSRAGGPAAVRAVHVPVEYNTQAHAQPQTMPVRRPLVHTLALRPAIEQMGSLDFVASCRLGREILVDLAQYLSQLMHLNNQLLHRDERKLPHIQHRDDAKAMTHIQETLQCCEYLLLNVSRIREQINQMQKHLGHEKSAAELYLELKPTNKDADSESSSLHAQRDALAHEVQTLRAQLHNEQLRSTQLQLQLTQLATLHNHKANV